MKSSYFILGGAAIIAIIVVILASGYTLPHIPNPDGRVVSVNGAYTAKAEPTRATLIIGFENTGNTAESAQKKNADEMANVLVALRRNGLTDDNFKTINYNIWDSRDYRQPDSAKTYHATHTLEISTDKLSMIGRYLDIAVSAGAKNVHSVRFSVSEEKQNELKKEALEKATQDARDKAEALASGLGLRVYNVVSIQDSSWDVGIHRVMAAEIDYARTGVHADTQVIPGDVEVSARVHAEFELA